jgi:hypothetical protein
VEREKRYTSCFAAASIMKAPFFCVLVLASRGMAAEWTVVVNDQVSLLVSGITTNAYFGSIQYSTPAAEIEADLDAWCANRSGILAKYDSTPDTLQQIACSADHEYIIAYNSGSDPWLNQGSDNEIYSLDTATCSGYCRNCVHISEEKQWVCCVSANGECNTTVVELGTSVSGVKSARTTSNAAVAALVAASAAYFAAF